MLVLIFEDVVTIGALADRPLSITKIVCPERVCALLLFVKNTEKGTRMSMRVSRRLSTVASVLILLAIPTIASAHGGNNDPNVVHACIANLTKAVRIVGVSGSCRVTETPAHWDIQGPQGAPGTNGTNGTDGTGGTRADGPCFDNTNRYVNCLNGTVTDTVTGLIWLQKADCFVYAPSYVSYSDANKVAARLQAGDCGLKDGSSPGDWRLPTKDEWSATIARAAAMGCKFVSGPFEVTPLSLTNDAGTACYGDGSESSLVNVYSSSYWSSSTDEAAPNNAWRVTLFYGQGFYNLKYTGQMVWPVRGGPR